MKRLWLAIMVAGWPCAGQAPLTLHEAVSRALRSHPLLDAGQARIAAAAGLLEQAGLRPNPRVTLQSENWRSYGTPGFSAGEDPDTFAYLSQPFETAGKRGRRMDAARTALRRTELEKQLLARQISARVRQAYWAAAGAAQVHRLWLETGRNFQQIIDYHEARVREGAMAEADLLKVRLEGERLAVAANAAGLEAERARIQLFREMGQTEFPEVALADPLEPVEPAAPADPARALTDRIEVQLARLAVEQARADLRLQQAAARPDFDVMLGYKRTAGFHTALGGIQFTLPFSNRNQGNVAAAEAQSRAAASELAAGEALVRAEVRSAQSDVEMRLRQIGMLRSALDRAAESSRIARAAYREGGADLLGLLDAERVRIDLQVLYVRTLAEYRQSMVGLETAMGVEP